MEETEDGEGEMEMSQEEEERLFGTEEPDENEQISRNEQTSRKLQDKMDMNEIELGLIEEEAGTDIGKNDRMGQLIKDFADKVDIKVDEGSSKGEVISQSMKQQGKKKIKEKEEGYGKCQACGKIEEHTKKQKKWIGCDRCERWYIEGCVVKANEDVRGRYWQCPKCCIVARKIEDLVEEWEGVKGALTQMSEIIKENQRMLVEHQSTLWEEITSDEVKIQQIQKLERENAELKDKIREGQEHGRQKEIQELEE